MTSRLPYPPDRGDRLRAFHFLQHLSGDHDLSLVSFIAHKREAGYLEALRPYCRTLQVVQLSPVRSVLNVAANAWRPEPLQALYYRSAEMRRAVEQTLAESAFDAVYVHLFRMAQYVAARTGLYRIVDLTDVISEEVRRSLPYRSLPSRMIYRLEGPRIARYERWVACTFEESWLISRADMEVLAARCPEANVQVVPNGVDVGRFFPTGKGSRPRSLLFVGHLRVAHNVDAVQYFVREVLPRVRHQIPECTLTVVGTDPGRAVMRLAGTPGVVIRGYVPDLNETLNEAEVFVAPLRFGAGVQNKVLEAMAARRPVVATSLVNVGVGARSGEEILVADEPEEMASQVVRLLCDGALRARVGHAGMEFVRRAYRWEHVVHRMHEVEKLLQSMGQEARPGQPCRIVGS